MALIVVAIIIVLIALIIKFKPAYKVTLAGEFVGFVESKKIEQGRINDYMNNTEGNIAFIDIKEMPRYSFTLVSRDEKTSEDEILDKVKETAEITYKTYAISLDGDKQMEVATEEEANSIIGAVTEDLIEGVDMDFGINKVYTSELNLENKDEAIASLNEIKDERVEAYEAEKARQAAAAAAAARVYASSSYTYSSGGGNVGSMLMPVYGILTSRFGSRGGHTGLDIATSMGTPIRAAASGTVTSVVYSNVSYGNKIIIRHGDGVETLYAHLHDIWVDQGETVSAGQQIGCVGSTGNSTGPHLHFEGRVNGSPVNPSNYVD